MEKAEILKHLQTFIKAKREKEVDKKTSALLSTLSALTEEDISVGEQPRYFFANMTCNSTGVGESSYEGTTSQRTVARDYVTDTYLFVDGHTGAGEKGLSLFYLKPGQTIHYYKKSEIIKLAKEFGFQLHLQYFRDLNFTLRDHRLNRHTVNIVKGPFTYPVRPIYATLPKTGDKFAIGYIYEMKEKEHILIEPENPKKAGGKASCLPWALLGLIFPPILLVAGFLWLVQAQKERMRG